MFHPHPNSLDGSAKFDEVTLQKLGFTDVHNVIANTIEALKNAPGPSQLSLNKTDIVTLVKTSSRRRTTIVTTYSLMFTRILVEPIRTQFFTLHC